MTGVKCTNRLKLLVLYCVLQALILTGCGSSELMMPYNPDTGVSSYSIISGDDNRAETFASKLCIISGDEGSFPEIEEGADSYVAAGLFDVNNGQVIYSRNVFTTLYPASMTKVMTAICAMKYGNKDDTYVCSDNVVITEEGATLCGYAPGDKVTLDQAMHGLLMKSGNDAAIVIAEGIAGSVDNFCKLMNQEAKSLGATNTNFVNPNGLHDENHYSSAYDMYLIFNEAIKYEWFNEIINMTEYTTSYTTEDGKTKEDTYTSTNLFLKGDAIAPTNVTVIGGKTGTTSAAGNNLIMLSRDAGGNPYISIVMKANDRTTLYDKMTSVLEAIP